MVAAEPHVMVMGLHQHGLQDSEALAVFPLGAGAISLKADKGINTVAAGEIVGGQFRVLEKIPSKQVEGSLTFRIDEAQSQCVLLITSEGRLEHAHQLMNATVK